MCVFSICFLGLLRYAYICFTFIVGFILANAFGITPLVPAAMAILVLAFVAYDIYFNVWILENPVPFRTWIRAMVIDWEVFPSLILLTTSGRILVDLSVFCWFVILQIHVASLLSRDDIKTAMKSVVKYSLERTVIYVVVEARYPEALLLLVICLLGVITYKLAAHGDLPVTRDGYEELE